MGWKTWNAGIEERDEGFWNAGREREMKHKYYIYVNIYRGIMLTHLEIMLTYLEWVC